MKINSVEHELKILPKYFNDVYLKLKSFEIRKNDRDFHTGDILYLREYTGEEYTGRSMYALVTYVLTNAAAYGLMEGYCIMSIKVLATSLALSDSTHQDCQQ